MAKKLPLIYNQQERLGKIITVQQELWQTGLQLGATIASTSQSEISSYVKTGFGIGLLPEKYLFPHLKECLFSFTFPE